MTNDSDVADSDVAEPVSVGFAEGIEDTQKFYLPFTPFCWRCTSAIWYLPRCVFMSPMWIRAAGHQLVTLELGPIMPKTTTSSFPRASQSDESTR